MDTFIAGDIVWPQGQTTLQVYFLPDLREIKALVDIYRDVIDKFPFISPVPDQWLHATVQMIEQPYTGDIGLHLLADLETTLRQQIGGLAPFTLSVGGAVAGQNAVVLDLTPDEEFTALIHRSRAVIRDVLGEASVKYSHGRPHLTLGYARDHGDSGVVASQLRNATDRRATLTVTEVSLVDVSQDPVLHQYRWTELARLPLDDNTAQRPEAGHAEPDPVAADTGPTR